MRESLQLMNAFPPQSGQGHATTNVYNSLYYIHRSDEFRYNIR